MNNQRFASVWDAIQDTPEEAENMKLRSVLLTALKNRLNSHRDESGASGQALWRDSAARF